MHHQTTRCPVTSELFIFNRLNYQIYTSDIYNHYNNSVTRDSSVGIATRYGLDGSGTESQGGAEFFHNCPGAHPALCVMDTWSISRG
jgi:hypothetical protein